MVLQHAALQAQHTGTYVPVLAATAVLIERAKCR